MVLELERCFVPAVPRGDKGTHPRRGGGGGGGRPGQYVYGRQRGSGEQGDVGRGSEDEEEEEEEEGAVGHVQVLMRYRDDDQEEDEQCMAL